MKDLTETDMVIFATFFPECENFHLTKDVGMIPYILHREFNYDSYIICYKNGEYSYLDTDVQGMKIIFMKKRMNYLMNDTKSLFAKLLKLLTTIFDAFQVLLKYGRDIDVLQLYHLKIESIFAGLMYRTINKKGILYLKLDMNPDFIKEYNRHPKKPGLMLMYFPFKLAGFDVVSVETKGLYEFLRENHPIFKKFKDRLYYIPNGVDATKLSHYITGIDKKENTILHVGRIGSYQKASETILEAFAEVARDYPSWRLILIGPIWNKFGTYFDKFFEKNQDIKDRVAYLGFIDPREKLYEYYNKAKILAFPSRFESFGLVAVEAGIFGDVILGSDIPSVREITNNGKLGYLCPVDNVMCFTGTLKHMLLHEKELKEKSELFRKFIINNYNWNKICNNLQDIISNKQKRGN